MENRNRNVEVHPQRLNIVNIVREITELQKPIKYPTFLSAIVHPDYIIINWEEIYRKSWGSLPFKVPYIQNTCIEYKPMAESYWKEIKTNSDTTTSCCFYKKNQIHQYSQSHQVWNYFWNEYNALEEDIYYDIRFCYENYHETKNWTTISSIGIPSLPPTPRFCGFLTNSIENPIQNQCYLVLKNNDEIWSTYENCLAMYSNTRAITGWIIYYPTIGWKIDNFFYDGNEWIDLKLKNTMIQLYKSITSKDILFKILSQGYASRIFNENTLEQYYLKFLNDKFCRNHCTTSR